MNQPATSTDIVTTPCEFRARFTECGGPASEMLVSTDYHQNRSYEPRCKRHMGFARRAKYESRTIEPVTVEVRDQATARRAEEERQRQIDLEERRKARAEQTARWAEQTREETKVVYEVRQLAVQPSPWNDDEAMPGWAVNPVGTTENRLFGTTIRIKPRYGEPRLDLSISSTVTPNEARAIIAALSLALIEIEKGKKA